MLSNRRNRVIALVLIVVVALLIAGLVAGRIGQEFFGDRAYTGVLPQPAVHLPPQPVWPEEARHQFEEFEEHHTDKPFGTWQFFISNTILSSWLTSLVLIAIFVVGATRLKLVPRGLQNLCEMVIEALYNFVEGVVGKEWGRRVFPVIATIFLFVAFNAWMGLLPIYPSLGLVEGGWLNGHVSVHLLRPAGTDLNMPLALALVSFAFVEFTGLRALGFSYIGKFVRVKDLLRGKPTGAIDAFVGILEAFSEFIRILSFTFRLFGNMTAGEILVLIFTFLMPAVVTVAIYGLEILVGFVQALIFAGLTLVFAALALTPHSAEEH